MEKRNRQHEERPLVSKMLHHEKVGLEKNDPEDSREKHHLIIFGDSLMLLSFAFVWLVHFHETKDGQSLLREIFQKLRREKVRPKDNPPPRLFFFAKQKISPIFLVGKCIFNGQNKFYAWSHVKIFLFSSFKMVQFYHE